ncbi:SRPBCC domain-containing protein [Nocardioides jensenii]|uniref:SRPBCC domain-containing protein n=1 Tax=Nocardioides jensenii TaxID=1843 RepID=UPI00082EEF73|nr:SRPBCC domain-containing protein [Nocardioides jensenii]
MPRNPEASVEIDAPLDVVWRVMLDTASYPEWNPFVVRADCAEPRVGQPIVLHVRWANGKGTRSPERISVLEPPRTDREGTTRATLAYVFEGWPAKLGLVKGTRLQRLTQRPGGPTTYDTVEQFTGPMVKYAGPGRVADGFRRHAQGLKERAESLAR